MSGVPSFSSFPELPAAQSKGKEGGTRTTPPSFTSFPEYNVGDAGPSQLRHKSGRDEGEDRNHKSHRRESPGKGHRSGRRSEENHRSHRDDEDRARRRSRSRDRDERDTKQHRSSHNDHDRRRRRDEEKETDEERRQRKHDRRKREREQAERLVRGEQSGFRVEQQKESMPSGSWKPEDGRTWYESVTGPKRKGYEEPFDPTSNSAWFKDTVGDKDALRYSASASHSAPKYYRDKEGRILGLNEGIRIVHTKDKSEKGVELAPRGRPYIPRYSAKTFEGSASQHLGRVLLRPDGQADFDSNASFVSVGSNTKKRLAIDDTPDYRSITRGTEKEEDVELVEDPLSGYLTLDEDVRRQTIETERSLRERPDNVDLWIKYSILHLKSSPELSKSAANAFVDPTSLPQNRATAEVTLSILERGLEAHPNNRLSTALHIAYIRAAEKFWASDQITLRWKKVIRDLTARIGQPGTEGLEEGMISIWLGYIEWREGQGFAKSADQNGGVDEVIEVYAECLKELSVGRSNTTSQAREENQLYIFLRACLFIKQAGYTERAVAAFQAMIEITFFKPDRLRPFAHSGQEWFDGLLSEFEVFWDEEVPRFGEPRSKGWRDARADEVGSADPADVEHVLEDPYEKWLEAERHADIVFGRPGRANKLDDEDDPYRVVMFSDIQPLLFPVRSPEVRLQLVYAYLAFIGLPFTPPQVPSCSPTASDPHLRSSLAYNDHARASFWPPKAGTRRIPWQTVGGEPMNPENAVAIQHPYGCPIKNWTSERGTLFAQTARWFRDLDPVDIGHVDVKFARQSLVLLRPLIPDPSFTLAYFAFEAAVSPKSAVKTSKAILAENRDNLVLWDGYARLERQRGNIATARVVYATALQAALAKEDVEEEDKLEVWASWADMEFQEDESRCLEVVLMAMGYELGKLSAVSSDGYTPSAPSAITLLKARQRSKTIEPPFGPSQLVILALFAYLTDGIDSCRNVIMSQLGQVPPSSSYAEEAHQLLVNILHTHSSRHASPAALTRDALELAIHSFPQNTMFLSLYLFGELGNRVYGRVQKLIYEISASEEAGVVGSLWAVWAEAMSSHRTFWDKGGGGAERVRNALDRGINSTSGRHSIVLWKLYIEFEVMMGRYAAAKQLCYRAVAAIGGCKDLYLLPFTPDLRRHHTVHELNMWADLMTERGIRIRVPFEAYFNTASEEAVGMVLPDDEELQDDELRFLGEREELKPY